MRRFFVMAALLVQGMVLFPMMRSPADSSGMLLPLLLIPAAQLAAGVAILLGRAWGNTLAIIVSALLAVLCVPAGFMTFLVIASSHSTQKNWWGLVGVAAYLGVQVLIMFAADRADPVVELA